MPKISAVNPWSWQEAHGYSQGVQAEGGQTTLFCAGQTSVDGEGNPLHAGDMAAQLNQAYANLETVLAKAGMGFENVVRLNFYVTSIPAFFEGSAKAKDPFAGLSVKPAGTLLGVSALFHPDIMVEIEATAVA